MNLRLNDASQARHAKPRTREELHAWCHAYLGVNVSGHPVCRDHATPMDVLEDMVLTRPSFMLVHAPRGGGKSFLAGMATHITSRFHPGHGTKILGGSKDQSRQVYEALEKVTTRTRPFIESDADQLERILKTQARYRNGSTVSILAASPTSVRGPHVPTLMLDELDEIDEDIREQAVGMVMGLAGMSPAIVGMSTWHRIGGPMSKLKDAAKARKFPEHTYCTFDVLERCPDDLSGAGLEKCPECPLVKWCHEDKADHGGVPKAKRARGHYSIESLIQKTAVTSARVFESDYLCRGPKAAGVWFKDFSRGRHVRRDEAEYKPWLPVHLAIDPGVFCGAVFFQVTRTRTGRPQINVFADWLREDIGAEANALGLLELARQLCNGRLDVVSMDPAGKARTSVGVKVINEFLRVGCHDPRGEIREWDNTGGSVGDGLKLLEALLLSASGDAAIVIHERCTHLIDAFENYRRAKRRGFHQDYPDEEQHPFEDLMDPLRGGIGIHFPEGLAPERPMIWVPHSSVF